MQVIIAFANHSFQGSKNSVTPKRVIVGKICTSKSIPSSVIPKPINPMMLKIANPFVEWASTLFFTARNTNLTDKIQFTSKPMQKPNAVAITKEITFQVLPSNKAAGKSH